MLTCKEASLLISKQMEIKLPWRERMALRVHVSLCHQCAKYLRDLKKLSLFVQDTFKPESSETQDSMKLSEQERLRINTTLKSASIQKDSM